MFYVGLEPAYMMFIIPGRCLWKHVEISTKISNMGKMFFTFDVLFYFSFLGQVCLENKANGFNSEGGQTIVAMENSACVHLFHFPRHARWTRFADQICFPRAEMLVLQLLLEHLRGGFEMGHHSETVAICQVSSMCIAALKVYVYLFDTKCQYSSKVLLLSFCSLPKFLYSTHVLIQILHNSNIFYFEHFLFRTKTQVPSVFPKKALCFLLLNWSSAN